MSALVKVHGGLDTPINRIIPLSRRQQFLKEASEWPTIEVSKADVSMIYRFGDGTLSPLSGPMDEATWHRVLEKESIEYNFKSYAWTIPMSLPLTDEEATKIQPGQSVALRDHEGNIFASLEHVQVFDWDKPKYLESVYGTSRTDHPGADQVVQDPRRLLIGGDVWTLPQAIDRAYRRFVLSPKQTRLLIEEQKWERALAFQTRNPLHRAHEYALVAGIERLTEQGHFAGAILNPLIGELKGDDVPAKTRMSCYQSLVEKQLLGEGDKNKALWASKGYDINEVFSLIGLDIKMFYGGPKEAVMHAIYRQNHGFSDIIIGRKHADAPYFDGSPIWGDFDAQEIFKSLKGHLDIQTCPIGFAAYYESLQRVDLVENHPNEKPVSISGSKIREMLRAGEAPDARIIRPETSAILIDYYRD